MKSNKVLLEYLSGLSPLLKKLVEKAIKEKINIVPRFQCCAYLLAIGRNDLIPSEKWMAAGDFPEIGLERIIIIPLDLLLKEIEAGGLGFIELGFAHEIAHIRTWSDTPFCNKEPTSYNCAYREILAYKVALDILKELHPMENLELLVRAAPVSVLEILGTQGYPSAFITECKSCDSLEERKLDKCPKEEDIKKLVKIIKKSHRC